VCFTPVLGSQLSVVQELPSSTFTGVWLMAPDAGLQESVVHALLSSTFTAVCFTPVTGSHESVVQALPSSTCGGDPFLQFPLPSQVSSPSQTLLLPQSVPLGTKFF